MAKSKIQVKIEEEIEALTIKYNALTKEREGITNQLYILKLMLKD